MCVPGTHFLWMGGGLQSAGTTNIETRGIDFAYGGNPHTLTFIEPCLSVDIYRLLMTKAYKRVHTRKYSV